MFFGSAAASTSSSDANAASTTEQVELTNMEAAFTTSSPPVTEPVLIQPQEQSLPEIQDHCFQMPSDPDEPIVEVDRVELMASTAESQRVKEIYEKRLSGGSQATEEEAKKETANSNRDAVKNIYKKAIFPDNEHPSKYISAQTPAAATAGNEHDGFQVIRAHMLEKEQGIYESKFDMFAPKVTVDDANLLLLPDAAKIYRDSCVVSQVIVSDGNTKIEKEDDDQRASVKMLYAKRSQNPVTRPRTAEERANAQKMHDVRAAALATCASRNKQVCAEQSAMPNREPALFSAFIHAEDAMQALERAVGKTEALNLITNEIVLFNQGAIPQILYTNDRMVSLKAGNPPIQVSIQRPPIESSTSPSPERELYVRMFAIVHGVAAFYTLAASVKPIVQSNTTGNKNQRAANCGTPMKQIYSKRSFTTSKSTLDLKDLCNKMEPKSASSLTGFINDEPAFCEPTFKPMRTFAVAYDKKINSMVVDLIKKEIGPIAAHDFFRTQVKFANGNEMPELQIEQVGIVGMQRARLIAKNLDFQMEMLMPVSFRKADAADKLFAAMYVAAFDKTETKDATLVRAFARLKSPLARMQATQTKETATEPKIVYLPQSTPINDVEMRDMNGNSYYCACDGKVINGRDTNYVSDDGIVYKFSNCAPWTEQEWHQDICSMPQPQVAVSSEPAEENDTFSETEPEDVTFDGYLG